MINSIIEYANSIRRAIGEGKRRTNGSQNVVGTAFVNSVIGVGYLVVKGILPGVFFDVKARSVLNCWNAVGYRRSVNRVTILALPFGKPAPIICKSIRFKIGQPASLRVRKQWNVQDEVAGVGVHGVKRRGIIRFEWLQSFVE